LLIGLVVVELVGESVIQLAVAPCSRHLAQRGLLFAVGDDAAPALLLDVQPVIGKAALQLLP
jgi:hypothetical protein